ncbi:MULTISPECIES: helix-turn-helix domain-containing protein [Pseudomonas aeruginosa group]|uniref:Helix-turn-helix domain-containing protein n=1 Tax=Pseudomonas nitroreducens TaxID=46680 RepID=A0A6G6IWM6_PSENT|nr:MULTISPECIES: helix-turn-helix domain-containing protein [Pseudomonas aeruginosa group]QIE87357.1 helix-turn-helix domain-containing protein [Pseudomonas nitroreducens]
MNKPRTNDTALRVLRVLKALKGHSLMGLSNGELAKALDESPANITRYLSTLVDSGLATKLDTGRYAPGIALLQIAQAHANEMANAQNRINEINQRVLAGASR